MTDPVHYST